MLHLERSFLPTTDQYDSIARSNRLNGKKKQVGDSLINSEVPWERSKTTPASSKQHLEPHSNSDTGIDKRQQVPRPFMHTASRTIVTSLYDIERAYEPTSECNKWGGSKYMEDLNQSVESLVKGGKSNLLSFRNRRMDVYFGQNISVVVTMMGNYTNEKQAQPEFRLEVDGTLEKPLADRLHSMEQKGVVGKMGWNVRERKDIPECTDYIEYPVMLVDNNINTWNWWFFLQGVLHHYIAFAVVQPHIMGDYLDESLRVLFTSDDTTYSRSNLDAFEFLFSDRRARDSRQVWRVDPTNGDETNKRYCFRKLLWSPGNFGGQDLLVNKVHPNMGCFSSIIYSYAAYMKAAMHIPTLPRPKKPRVVWVGRDPSNDANPTSWQKNRIVANQEEVISYLREKCSKIGIELIVADFFGEKKDTPFQEQVTLVSRANIMIGMHGAGLNMFHFMPFNSVIVELHRGTDGQKNSVNFVNHVRDGAYISGAARINRLTHNIELESVWSVLQKAIAKWENLAIKG